MRSSFRLGSLPRHGWIFLTAFFVGFSGAIVPGPMLAATLGGAVQNGPITGPRIVLGHALIEIALVAMLAFGRGQWLRDPRAFRLIAIIGGGLLGLMGLDMLLRSADASAMLQGTESTLFGNDVFAGIITSISNPYFIIWWATVGLAMIQDAQARGSNAAVFFCGHILSDVVWFCAIAWVVGKSRTLESVALPDSVFGGVFAVCGIALIGLGVWFVVSGFRKRATASIPK